jgi:hypothetical protein
MTKKEFSKMLLEINELQKMSSLPNVDEKSIFKLIGQLDSKYSLNKFFSHNINGIICNLGSDLKNKNLLKYAYSRLEDKIKTNNDNKFLFDLANCVYCLAELDCPYPPSINQLLETNLYNKARKAFSFVKKDEHLHLERALTNTANILEKYGRNYEAILMYDKILVKKPDFGMALANKAQAIDYYIHLSPYKSFRLMRTEVQLFAKALKDSSLDEIGGGYARTVFQKKHDEIKRYLIDQKQWTDEERQTKGKFTDYEKYNLENNLFLNYDFGFYYDGDSLKDNLFPNLIENIHDERSEKNKLMSSSVYFTFQVFNQILESYTASRFLFFQSIKKNYMSLDKKVGYVYAYDYTIHGNKFGIQKSVFCDLFNCLDKIAHLVTFYFFKEKEHLPKNIYFNWLQTDAFGELVDSLQNYQLLALRNLSLDFEEGYQYNYLREMRNRITHSFLNINEGTGFNEKFIEYEITEEMLKQNVLKMLSIVKSALLYYTIAVRLAKSSEVVFSMKATFEKDIYF